MIHEYAVEPTIFKRWEDFLFFMNHFGVHRGRLISKFPKKWKRLVYEACKDFKDLQRKKVSSRLQKDDFLISSKRDYGVHESWLENALEAHQIMPFRAILTQKENCTEEMVLTNNDLWSGEEHELFICPTEKFMAKNEKSFAEETRVLLSVSKNIIFVDPYLKSNVEYGAPLLAMLRNVPPDLSLLRYCTRFPRSGETLEFREKELANLERYIPKGLVLEVVLIEKLDSSDTHNRFILTDRGGIKFPWGLDTKRDEPRDTINLMQSDVCRTKYDEFFSLSTFSVVKKMDIHGMGN